MEENKSFNFNMILSIVSLCSSLLAMIVMYYIFSGIALVTGLISMNDEKSRKMSITSMVIVCITFVVKIVTIVVQNGNLPAWLTSGLF